MSEGKRGWSIGSVRSRVYWTVRVDGAVRDMQTADLVEALAIDMPDITTGTVRGEVNALRKMGLLLDGPRGYFLKASTVDDVPYPLERLQKMLLPMLQDCEAGVSRAALAREAQVSQAEVVAALRPLVLRYELRQITIDRPAHLDGGPGYRVTPGQVQAREAQVDWQHPLAKGTPTAEAVLADARHIVQQAVPAAVDTVTSQHRHAMVGQHGAYAVTAGSQLQVAWGSDQAMRITLPAAVTRELLGWLNTTAEGLVLGGADQACGDAASGD